MTSYDAFLEHYGVAGMKWGRRRGSFASRVQGASLDNNQRKLARATRVAEGRGSAGDKVGLFLTAAPGKIIANKGLKNYANVQVSKLNAQKARIESGKKTALDKLEDFGSIGIADLMYSTRDAKG